MYICIYIYIYTYTSIHAYMHTQLAITFIYICITYKSIRHTFRSRATVVRVSCTASNNCMITGRVTRFATYMFSRPNRYTVWRKRQWHSLSVASEGGRLLQEHLKPTHCYRFFVVRFSIEHSTNQHINIFITQIRIDHISANNFVEPEWGNFLGSFPIWGNSKMVAPFKFRGIAVLNVFNCFLHSFNTFLDRRMPCLCLSCCSVFRRLALCHVVYPM